MIKMPNFLTFVRAVSGLNVDEPNFSSMRTLRVELKERKCEICWFKFMFKQTHDNKFNAKRFIRHINENILL